MTKSKGIASLGGSAHWSQTDKRNRADSVLGNRMDDLQDYRKLAIAKGSKWRKLRTVIDQPETKLMLIEVPKNVSESSVSLINENVYLV